MKEKNACLTIPENAATTEIKRSATTRESFAYQGRWAIAGKGDGVYHIAFLTA